MQVYHSREDALNDAALEMRVIKHSDDREYAVHMEKRNWYAYDFITGRIYGHQYVSDAKLREWIEGSLSTEPSLTFQLSFEQWVIYLYSHLTGQAPGNA